jgi:hypothetical protein
VLLEKIKELVEDKDLVGELKLVKVTKVKKLDLVAVYALGFEGGQMPIYRRLPKRGFSNAMFKKEYAVLILSNLAEKFDGEVVNRENLIAKGLLSGKEKAFQLKFLTKVILIKLNFCWNCEIFCICQRSY